AIRWRDRSVADLLATSITDALPLFADQPEIRRRLSTLDSVGLGYLTLGQPLNTLSGGESQRLKLVRYLGAFSAQPSTVSSDPLASRPSPIARVEEQQRGALLLLDEPTTGLHRHDVKRLLSVLQALVDRGHSVVVIEHNLDVLKSADWLIEIGPDAGANGGRIVAEGPPELLATTATATAPYLRAALGGCHIMYDNGSAALAPAELAAAEAPASYGSESLNFQPSTLNPISTSLEIVGARENNLKNLSLAIPHHEFNVVTGVSGSGKSTLAFDIVFAEGQRRFMESMSPYARQFVEQLPRPAIDRLTGIPPTVAIEQRVTRGSRKSTVATITEVAQYLRLLYARLGIQHHPETNKPVTPLSPGQLRQLLARVLATPRARRAKHLYLCAPLIRGRKGHHQPIATWIEKQGYELMRADGRVLRADVFQKLDRYKEHDIEVVVADLKARNPESGAESKATQPKSGSQPSTLSSQLTEALRLGHGSCFLLASDGRILSWFSTTRTDIESGESFPELDPKHFSFNSPRGWCPTCRGHGRVFPWMIEFAGEDDEDDPAKRLRDFGIDSADDLSDTGTPCPECHGARLNRIARAVKLHFRPAPRKTSKTRTTGSVSQLAAADSQLLPALSLPQLLASTPAQLLAHLRRLDLDARGRLITQDIIPQIEERLKFLDHVGLGYLSLDRPTETLSGGEAQRIRLAAQLGSNLSGVLYVLDEPSIGLHARDNDRLIETLQSLRQKGNTLLVVEHDEEVMAAADRIIDLGPAAGVHGGELLANGTPAEIKRTEKSLTGLFLNKGIAHPLRGKYRVVPGRDASPRRPRLRAPVNPGRLGEPSVPTPSSADWLELRGAAFRNLKSFDLRLPLGRLIMVAGPSGAGKSTLFRDLLHPAVAHAIKTKSKNLPGRSFARATNFTDDTSRPSPLASHPPFGSLRGAQAFKGVLEVDPSPIGT
ncbi:MAG TPA: excinuclease ABC subunit A, partial [Opitutus sp.]|nr:excinuclease ABC subunit A [Opitutus sp.]